MPRNAFNWVADGVTAALLLVFNHHLQEISLRAYFVLSPPMPYFPVFEVVGGVLWCLTFLVDVGIDLAKIGAAVLPTLPPAFIILNILVLVLAPLIFKRVKVSNEVAVKTPEDPMSDHIQNGTLIVYEGPRRHLEDMTVLLVLILAAQFQFITRTAVTGPMALALLDGAEDSEDTEVSDIEQAQFIPGDYYRESSFLRLVFSFLAICYSVALDIICRIVVLCSCVPGMATCQILGTIIKHTVRTLTKDNAGHSSEPDDEADITLVEENGPLKDSKYIPSSPFPSPVRLSASQSAPVVTSVTNDYSGLRASTSCQLRADAPLFLPPSVSTVHHDAAIQNVASSDVPTVEPKAGFIPSVSSSVPKSASLAQDISAVNAKKDREPVRPLSFQWARGGCPTCITAPPAPTPLNASASAFVPKNRAPAPVPVVDRPGLSASIWASSSPSVLVKKEIIFRRAPPSFSPGGCAVPIVPPPPSAT
ncbi:hypothetical protein B0H19DRAFT_1373778 [Mycena capillaripes]|nr:hypothetical protein B0H19DRAFT_1373778 [Mycena capillaripes]